MTFQRHHLSLQTQPFEIERRGQEPTPTMKPKGLWYEVDGDWRRWCEAESFGDISKHTLFRLTLGEERMLNIRNVRQLDKFHDEYIKSEMHTSPIDGQPFEFGLGIRWDRVALRFDGIEIAPYLWERRLASGFIWYYGWDCASGCIWRPKGATLTIEEGS